MGTYTPILLGGSFRFDTYLCRIYLKYMSETGKNYFLFIKTKINVAL